MTDARLKWIMYGSIIGVLAGVALGYALPEAMLAVAFIGGLFLNGLKVLIAPLIVTSLVVGITSLGSGSKVGRTTISAFLYFAATTAIAVTIGLILVMLVRPGVGFETVGSSFPSILSDYRGLSFTALLGSLIPSSIPVAVLQGNYLGLVVISVIFGLVLAQLGRAGKKISDLFTDFNDLIFKLIELVMVAMPVGLLFLIGYIVAANPGSIDTLFSGTGAYALVVLAAFAIHGFLVIPAALKIFTSRSLGHTSSRMLPAFAAAFGSASSTAALPVTTDCAINRCQIDRRAGSYVLPLGSVLNVDATAMYAIIGTMFIAQAFAVALSFPQVLLLSLIAVALSFGVSAIPNSSLFIMFVLLGIGGFPTEAYGGLGILAIFDWLFDRLRAVLNIWSDTVGAAVVAETFEFKTGSRIRSPRAQNGQRPGRRERSATNGSSKWSDRKPRSDKPEDRRPIRGRRAERSESKVAPDRPRRQRTETSPRKEPSPFQVSAAEDHPIDLDSPVTASTRRKVESKSSKPDRRSSKRTESSEVRTPRPNVKREAAKVAEQLASMDKEKQKTERTVPPRPSREKELTSEPETVSAPFLPPPPPLPVFDKKPEPTVTAEVKSEPEADIVVETARQIEKPTVAPTQAESKDLNFEAEDVATEIKVVDDEIEENEPELTASPQFGRQNQRKGGKSAVKKVPVETTSEEKPAEEVAYSTDAQSFGRTKRKRVRK